MLAIQVRGSLQLRPGLVYACRNLSPRSRSFELHSPRHEVLASFSKFPRFQITSIAAHRTGKYKLGVYINTTAPHFNSRGCGSSYFVSTCQGKLCAYRPRRPTTYIPCMAGFQKNQGVAGLSKECHKRQRSNPCDPQHCKCLTAFMKYCHPTTSKTFFPVTRTACYCKNYAGTAEIQFPFL